MNIFYLIIGLLWAFLAGMWTSEFIDIITLQPEDEEEENFKFKKQRRVILILSAVRIVCAFVLAVFDVLIGAGII